MTNSSNSLADKILVPLDSSLISERALPYAQEMARQSGSELCLFYIAVPARISLLITPIAVPPEQRRASTTVWATAYLKTLAENIASTGLRVGYEILEIPKAEQELEEVRIVWIKMISEQILQRAARPDINMLVISSHGFTVPDAEDYGNITALVIASCPKPILVIRTTLEGDIQEEWHKQ